MLSNNQSQRLVKHIIRSYARLSENSRVRGILKDNLPSIFKDKNFLGTLDETSRRWIQNIYKHLNLIGKSQENNDEVVISSSKEKKSSNNPSTSVN